MLLLCVRSDVLNFGLRSTKRFEDREIRLRSAPLRASRSPVYLSVQLYLTHTQTHTKNMIYEFRDFAFPFAERC